MNKIFFITIAIFLCQCVQAQDPVFSSPLLSPLNLNPAFTGIISSSDRLSIASRNQFSFLGKNAFNTYTASYDHRFHGVKYDYFGIGLSLQGDQSGELNFKKAGGKVSLSYQKLIDAWRSRKTFLSGGIEFGFFQRSIDLSKAKWGSQHDGAGGFDQNLYSGSEYYDNTNINYFDMGAGLLFHINDPSQAKKFYIGGAYFHLNKINQSFRSDVNIKSSNRILLHLGGEFPIVAHKKSRLLPHFFYHHQSPSRQLLGGMDYKYMLNRQKGNLSSIRLGSSLRMVQNYNYKIVIDALVLRCRVDYRDLTVGLSYDLTVSSLARVNNTAGGFELGIQYLIHRKGRQPIICPDF